MKNFKKNVLFLIIFGKISHNMYPMFDFDHMHLYNTIENHLTNLHQSWKNLMKTNNLDEQSPQEIQQHEQHNNTHEKNLL